MTIALGSRSSEFEKKVVGVVSVITGKTKAKLTMQDSEKKFKNGANSITVDLDSLPKRPKILPDDKSGKEYRVRMSQDGDEVEAFTPVRGHHTAKLVDIGYHKEGEAPYPKEKPNWGDSENTHLEFFATYEITSGPFKGVQTPGLFLHYKFEEDPEDRGFTRFAGNFENKKSTRLFQLRDWGQAHGLWEEAIPWDDDEGNILPIILERALENDREVELTFDKGYIILVQASENYEEPEDADDVEEEFPPVKSKANGSKKPAPASKVIKAKKVKQSHEDEDDDL